MFQFNKKTPHFDVIIGETSSIRGDVESEGSIRIDGRLDGSVSSKGEVIISQRAIVNGNIYAQLVDVFGKCTGNIVVQSYVTLHPEAVLHGDVRAESMHTERGAEFTGHCTILNKSQPAERTSERGEARPAAHPSERPTGRIPLRPADRVKQDKVDTSTRSIDTAATRAADGAADAKQDASQKKMNPPRNAKADGARADGVRTDGVRTDIAVDE